MKCAAESAASPGRSARSDPRFRSGAYFHPGLVSREPIRRPVVYASLARDSQAMKHHSRTGCRFSILCIRFS
jgi:hypothetical protein